MGKRLTKLEALDICRKLWNWLSKNQNREKQDWPGWIDYKKMAADCPCCEFVTQRKNQSCEKNCPLRGYWVDGKYNKKI